MSSGDADSWKMFYSLFLLLNLSCYQTFFVAIEGYKASGLADANKQTKSDVLILLFNCYFSKSDHELLQVSGMVK